MLECTEEAWLPWMHVIKKYAEAETKKARLSWGGPNALKKDLILYREAGKKGGEASAKVAPASDDTAEATAKETGVSPRTVKRDAKFATSCDALVDMVNEGKISESERVQIMERPKTEIIKASASHDSAKKLAKPKPPRKKAAPKPKETPWEKILNLLPKLSNDQHKELHEILERRWL